MRQAEKTADTVEEAVAAAVADLGIAQEDAEVHVIEEPSAGRQARVRVQQRERATDRDALEEQADTAADFVEELIARMGIDGVAEPSEHGHHMYVDIEGEEDADLALLIGRHGQTLDAIQELTRLVVARRLDERCLVVVDVQGYRRRREERLVALAQDAAQRVLSGGGEEELEPMTAFERKIVHDAVAEIPGVETSSRGEEPDRAVVIARA